MSTGILGVFAREAPATVFTWMAGDTRAGSGSGREVYLAPGAALLADEHAARTGGAVSVLERDGVIVAADAALYYRHDLVRRLAAAGVATRDDSAAELIHAAYQARGESCAEWLEGDFAFVLWDSHRRQLVCARDFVGSRPLFYLAAGDEVLIGSSASEVARHPSCASAVDVNAVAAFVACLLNADAGTGFRGVHEVRPGHTLVWTPDAGARLVPHWAPPLVHEDDTLTFIEAANELRHLLSDAVTERLDAAAPTAMWLSGGYDSSAVFACGMQAVRTGDHIDPLVPVSMSYPEGDPGREDELIESIASRWNAPVQWESIADTPLLPSDPDSAARRRDTVYAHVYEGWNRALAHRSRGEGARVALVGDGGDELFSNSSLYFGDLFWRGDWRTFARDWHLQRGRTLDGFGRFVLAPALPPAIRASLNRVTNRELVANPFQTRVAPWVRRGYLRRAGLAREDADRAPSPRPGALAGTELLWILTAPFQAATRAATSRLAREEGIEVRRPLLDGRVVAFAARRPRRERVGGGETKRLLRRAMTGLLPDDVLAPRSERTGTTGGYLLASLRGVARQHLTTAFESPVLADLDLVDARALRRSWERLLTGAAGTMEGFHLYRTYQAELWLRQRLQAPENGTMGGGAAGMRAAARGLATRSVAMR